MPSQQEIERTVEEIAETVYLKIVTRAGIPVEHIAEALQAERQKRDQELQKAREEERERIIYVTKNIKDTFMSPLTERRWLQCIQFTDQPKPEEQSELDQPTEKKAKAFEEVDSKFGNAIKKLGDN